MEDQRPKMKRYIHGTRLKDLVEQDGKSVWLVFASLTGKIIDMPHAVCIGVDPKYRRHTYKDCVSTQIRKVRDVLVLQVNDTEIIWS